MPAPPVGRAHPQTGRADALLAWGARQLRALPWRATRDPWAVLVSEVMAQQTGVDRVIPYWHAFLDRFPTPAACAAAPAAEVVRLWSGLGYNRRAVNIHRCAQAVTAHHGGELPGTLGDLTALPGIGPYTARAVLAFAFEQAVGVVDTNVGRVLARWEGRPLRPAEAQALADARVHQAVGTPAGADPPGSHRAPTPAGTGDQSAPARPGDRRDGAIGAAVGAGIPDLGSSAPVRSWLWNQAVMELGGTVCRRRTPDCRACPVRPWCGWAAAGLAAPDPADGSAGVGTGQPRFEGSDRQGRGRLVDALCREPVAAGDAAAVMGWPDDPARAERVVAGLLADGLAERDGDTLRLP